MSPGSPISPRPWAAASSSARSVSAQRPFGSCSCGGSAAKRGTANDSGGISGRSLGKLDEHRDRAVVHELDLHVRAEHAALGAEPGADALVERLGDLRPGGRDVARAVAFARVAVERELADDDRLAV